MQIYKEMDIGTAKPSKDSICKYKYYGIDIVFPDQWFSTGDYYNYIKNLLFNNQNNICEGAIFVGGTGLYYDSITKGLSLIPPKDENIRKNLEERICKEGLKNLYDELLLKDKEYAIKISPNDKKRIIRALEVIYLTNKKFSLFHDSSCFRNISESALFKDEEMLIYGINIEKNELIQNIKKRLSQMFSNGLLNEAFYLWRKYIYKDKPSFKGIGYYHIFSLINFIFLFYPFINKEFINELELRYNNSYYFKELYYEILFEIINYKFLNYLNQNISLNQRRIFTIFSKYFINRVKLNPKEIKEDLLFLFSETYSRDFLNILFNIGNSILIQLSEQKILNEYKNYFNNFSIVENWCSKNNTLYNLFIKRIELDTIAFSKRQLTWFQKDKKITWLPKDQIFNKIISFFN